MYMEHWFLLWQSRANIKKEARELLNKITSNLCCQKELLDLIEEYNRGKSKEAHFVFQVSKFESDIQAKIYDLEGSFNLEKALEDAKYYREPLSSEIIPKIKNASDGWVLYDRHYYMKCLQNYQKNSKILKIYKTVVNTVFLVI